jgi:predicted PurR-regulated permease PerM
MECVVDNVVRTLILQGRSNMHPLVSLIAVFGGMEMFGLIGIFLEPILAAVLIALLQLWPAVGQRFGLLPSAPGGEGHPRRERSAS